MLPILHRLAAKQFIPARLQTSFTWLKDLALISCIAFSQLSTVLYRYALFPAYLAAKNIDPVGQALLVALMCPLASLLLNCICRLLLYVMLDRISQDRIRTLWAVAYSLQLACSVYARVMLLCLPTL